jgi:sec-independent protein translocase protein TatA
MPHIGVPELVIILIVALLIFGPRKLPEFGKAVGESIREFRRSMTKSSKKEEEPVIKDSPEHAPR